LIGPFDDAVRSDSRNYENFLLNSKNAFKVIPSGRKDDLISSYLFGDTPKVTVLPPCRNGTLAIADESSWTGDNCASKSWRAYTGRAI